MELDAPRYHPMTSQVVSQREREEPCTQTDAVHGPMAVDRPRAYAAGKNNEVILISLSVV